MTAEDRIHQDALRVVDALLEKMNLQKACYWMVSPLPPGLLGSLVPHRERRDRQGAGGSEEPVMLVRAYKYRVYPTPAQVRALETQLRFCCQLYNAALEERREAWRKGVRVTHYDQLRQLTAIRAEGLALAGMNCQAQRDALRRLELAFDGFFRRCKSGDKPGYPRFRSAARYDSLTWPVGNGATLTGDRLRLQGVGGVRMVWHRPLPPTADLRAVTIRRSGARWHATVVLRIAQPEPTVTPSATVGIDLGVSVFAALSTGELAAGPRSYQKAQRRLRVAQRRVARRKKGSHRRRKAGAILARNHERVRSIRRDHAHKFSARLVREYGLIAVEALNIRGMARSQLAKQIHDQSWGEFIGMLRYKAEEAGTALIEVNPRNTSRTCAACGVIDAKSRRTQAEFVCVACGHGDHADVNAARNILVLGLDEAVRRQREAVACA